MAGLTLTVDIDSCLAGLDQVQTRLADLSGPMAVIGETIVSMAKESFELEQSPAGQPWKKSKRVLAEGGQTLAISGRLKKSLNSQPGQQEVLVGVLAGSDVVYAAIHQLGGEAGRNHLVTIDARPYMPDEETLDLDEIESIILDHLLGDQEG